MKARADYKSLTVEEFSALPMIETFLPLTFTGAARWTSLEYHCASCGRAFRSHEFRGRVWQWGQTYELEGFGYCDKPCNRLTSARLRFYPNMSWAAVEDGVWVRYGSRKVWTSTDWLLLFCLLGAVLIIGGSFIRG